ncbi:MAG: DUF87 domain-containing protein, partial [Pseudomonadota bacterium]
MTPPSNAARAERPSTEPPAEPVYVGEIVSVNGSHALMMLDEDQDHVDREHRPQLGAIMSIDAGATVSLGLVSAVSNPSPGVDSRDGALRIVELELIGEFTKPSAQAPARFRRGVSSYPTLGDPVYVSTRDELSALFSVTGAASVRVGVVKQDAAIPATVSVNDLFSRHCAVVGTTGAGKSCAIALMLRAVLNRYANAHIVVLDPHNEYAPCFGDHAVVFDSDSLTLPYWMLTFDEFVEILYPGRDGHADEIDILADLIPTAKRLNLSANNVSVRSQAGRRSVAT